LFAEVGKKTLNVKHLKSDNSAIWKTGNGLDSPHLKQYYYF